MDRPSLVHASAVLLIVLACVHQVSAAASPAKPYCNGKNTQTGSGAGYAITCNGRDSVGVTKQGWFDPADMPGLNEEVTMCLWAKYLDPVGDPAVMNFAAVLTALKMPNFITPFVGPGKKGWCLLAARTCTVISSNLLFIFVVHVELRVTELS
jgi:hypothetical protein